MMVISIITIYCEVQYTEHTQGPSGSGSCTCLGLFVLLAQVASWLFILPFFIFQSLLRTTLLHPKAEHSYAQYEITQLLPGIELFTDQFRADICSVIASLYYVIRELHYAKYNLIVSDL